MSDSPPIPDSARAPSGLRGRVGGFTLVEVLIVLALGSLVMLGLTAALRSFGETGARLEAKSAQAEDLRTVSAFLRQTLAAASAQRRPDRAVGGRSIYFAGDGMALEWLAPLPARHGVGGLHRLRLSLREEDDTTRLVLQFVPYVPGEADIDWAAEPVQMLAEVGAFAIAYQAPGSPAWLDAWHDPARLPARVRVSVADPGGPWPDLVVAILGARGGIEGTETERGQEVGLR